MFSRLIFLFFCTIAYSMRFLKRELPLVRMGSNSFK